MHVLHVSTQQLRAVEGLGALRTVEHLVPGVAQLVLTHVAWPHKALAAVAALRRLHLGVCGLVGLQVGFLGEVLPTDVTAKPPDTWRVDNIC